MSATPTSVSVDTSTWKTCSDKTLKFSLKYPTGYTCIITTDKVAGKLVMVRQDPDPQNNINIQFSFQKWGQDMSLDNASSSKATMKVNNLDQLLTYEKSQVKECSSVESLQSGQPMAQVWRSAYTPIVSCSSSNDCSK